MSEDTKKKCSESHIGLQAGENHPFFGKHLSEDHKQKLRDNHPDQFGNLNPNWKGGISSEEYSLEFNNILKERIRERDGHICQLCGEGSGNGKLPDVHHIDYNKKNNDPWNLITLCHRCHMKTNGRRKYWTSYFQDFQRDRKLQAQNEEIEIIRRPKA